MTALLSQYFGFTGFRVNQLAVCQAAVEGHDVLLVMPTGSGKSLCYQLPAIARGATALVISPLIALIEDQCAKLNALGLRAARIHSGLDRADSRQVCVDYLAGNLNFLFIAPERLRVPGFPEMLAKLTLGLVAIDEAHCISQWGHDFRPDYRMLGQYLPALRPAPVVALTATATPAVQRDILTQLAIPGAKKFVHGFRRDNLAIEVLEVPMPMRPDRVVKLLKDPAARPAIVYAPSRKRAEELAVRLREICPTAAYHAGLPNELRDSIQQGFQAGRIECVVATIAFGMGIDKADIRTVIHVALPATLEGYYQEIGRAGRDGQLSHTVLMHSYGDQRTHDFFLNRDYPAVDELSRLHRALTHEPQSLDLLRARVKMDEESFAKAIEKLYTYGGAEVDFANNATLGRDDWAPSYTRQSDHRRNQFQLVQRYVAGHQCRMAALVVHFGDLADGRVACGQCDFCNPAAGTARSWVPATHQQQAELHQILDELRHGDGKSLGRLQKELPGDLTRKELETRLGALAKAGLVTVEDAEWIRSGETILFRKASLTEAGLATEPGEELAVLLPAANGSEAARQLPLSRPRRTAKAGNEARGAGAVAFELTPAGREREQVLKEWRAATAKKMGMPAFMVLHDRALAAIAHAAPATPNQLLEVPGMGPAKVEKYGEAILAACRQHPG